MRCRVSEVKRYSVGEANANQWLNLLPSSIRTWFQSRVCECTEVEQNVEVKLSGMQLPWADPDTGVGATGDSLVVLFITCIPDHAGTGFTLSVGQPLLTSLAAGLERDPVSWSCNYCSGNQALICLTLRQ